jgi:membrane-associated protease RseP (regulator of RpoE activity)
MDLIVTIAFGVLFFALIMLSVALHEIGHMVPAKLFGVRVPKYFVGFGPTAWSTVRGETEYGIKWFPLGGFVRLLGMYPPGSARAGRPTRLAELADTARATEWEEITPTDVADGRLFYQKKTWQKLVVLFGGPLMNLLIAFGLFWGITAGYGVYRAQTTIAVVQECIIPAGETRTECAATDPRTPAHTAGLRAGDRVVSFNEVAITSYEQLSSLIRANLDGEARLVVERDGQEVRHQRSRRHVGPVPPDRRRLARRRSHPGADQGRPGGRRPRHGHPDRPVGGGAGAVPGEGVERRRRHGHRQAAGRERPGVDRRRERRGR